MNHTAYCETLSIPLCENGRDLLKAAIARVGVKENLARVIAESGLSQSALARRIGEAPQWVNNRVLGVTTIKAEDIPVLARGLRMSVLDLCRALFEEELGAPAGEPTDAEWLAAFAPANPEVVTRKVLEDIAPELREMLRGVISEELDRRLTASTEAVQKR